MVQPASRKAALRLAILNVLLTGCHIMVCCLALGLEMALRWQRKAVDGDAKNPEVLETLQEVQAVGANMDSSPVSGTRRIA